MDESSQAIVITEPSNTMVEEVKVSFLSITIRLFISLKVIQNPPERFTSWHAYRCYKRNRKRRAICQRRKRLRIRKQNLFLQKLEAITPVLSNLDPEPRKGELIIFETESDDT